MTRVPPWGGNSAWIDPPCNSTIWRLMDKAQPQSTAVTAAMCLIEAFEDLVALLGRDAEA